MERGWLKAADYARLTLTEAQSAQLTRYENWLLEEAIPAGGLGPEEGNRLGSRHIGDSLLFAGEFPDQPDLVWDLGTGAGLPGIPLAISLPRSHFLLVDRSERRIDLVRRAIRILDLENCETLQADVSDLVGDSEIIVTRASLPPEEMAPVAKAHLRPGGVAVMGGSWRARPETKDWEVREIPPDPLDHTIWLLIMRAQ